MNRPAQFFMAGIALLLLAAFGWGIALAISYTSAEPPRPGDMPGFLSFVVSSMNALLAANLAAILGLNVYLRTWVKPIEPLEWMRQLAAALYVVALVVVFVCWAKADFTEDESRIVPVLVETAKQGFGILLAILAAVLGIQTVLTRLRNS